MVLVFFLDFCGRRAYPRRGSAGKTPAGRAGNVLCTWGRSPNGEKTHGSRSRPRRHDQRPRIDDGHRHQPPRQTHQAQQRTTHGPRHQAQQDSSHATQAPPTVTACTAPGPPQPRNRSTPTQPQPTPHIAPGRPGRSYRYTPITTDRPREAGPRPTLDHWTGSGQQPHAL